MVPVEALGDMGSRDQALDPGSTVLPIPCPGTQPSESTQESGASGGGPNGGGSSSSGDDTGMPRVTATDMASSDGA
eukprot:363796-Chlamydomonas_euryale.AAC.4